MFLNKMPLFFIQNSVFLPLSSRKMCRLGKVYWSIYSIYISTHCARFTLTDMMLSKYFVNWCHSSSKFLRLITKKKYNLFNLIKIHIYYEATFPTCFISANRKNNDACFVCKSQQLDSILRTYNTVNVKVPYWSYHHIPFCKFFLEKLCVT